MTVAHKNHAKTAVILALIVAILTALVLYFGIINKLPNRNIADLKIDGVVLPQAKLVAEFHFTDQYGKAFSQQNLKGRWSMLFFGFTNCGYVCPTTMAELNKMYKVLQTQLPDKQLPQVILVTVDPERDTTQKMKDYITAFNSNFIGIRADSTATENLENQMHITAIKMQANGAADDQYSVNHSSEILLINPEGKVQAYFNFPHKAETLVSEYKLILKTLG